jgi:hypothetical protein
MRRLAYKRPLGPSAEDDLLEEEGKQNNLTPEEKRQLMQAALSDARSQELAEQVRAFGESIEMNDELMPDDDVPIRRMTMQASAVKKK